MVENLAAAIAGDVQIYLSRPLAQRLGTSILRDTHRNDLLDMDEYLAKWERTGNAGTNDRVQPLRLALSEFIKARYQMGKFEEEYLEKEDWRRFFFEMLSPFSLSVALSIRITRVTNDLFGGRIRRVSQLRPKEAAHKVKLTLMRYSQPPDK